MALFGACMETRQPYQGCATLQTDLALGRLPAWCESIAYMDRILRYSGTEFSDITIAISLMNLDSGGYDRGGRYYGRDTCKLYELEIDTTNGTVGYYTVRAPDRQSLRKILKRLYPEAKVGQ